MSELPFRSPAQYQHLCSSDSHGEGWWFVFSGDRLLVELGPPDARPSDDPRVRSRPSFARLPLQKKPQLVG